ncbi:hypothetical protein HK099_000146 [Clydaea vesicula]|uniref:F-box domain-containing protein n=1 Tax=Clydaea vesicula TaxID=447962 RepID=A0AAD5TV23_9FUNG|nr:hypothetical protein HK099_000146 [Clydaea vesicula]
MITVEFSVEAANLLNSIVYLAMDEAAISTEFNPQLKKTCLKILKLADQLDEEIQCLDSNSEQFIEEQVKQIFFVFLCKCENYFNNSILLNTQLEKSNANYIDKIKEIKPFACTDIHSTLHKIIEMKITVYPDLAPAKCCGSVESVVKSSKSEKFFKPESKLRILVNHLPQEILCVIFSIIGEKLHYSRVTSNYSLLKVALVNRKWSYSALPILWSQLRTQHDDLKKLNSLVNGLELNKKYRETHDYWFAPNIVDLSFYSEFKNTLPLYKSIVRKLIKCILPFCKNLKSLGFTVAERERVEFNLDDLSFIFESCPQLTSLDINSIYYSWKQKTSEKETILKNAFSKLPKFSFFALDRDISLLFKHYPMPSLQYLMVDDITSDFCVAVSGQLKNLTVLNLVQYDITTNFFGCVPAIFFKETPNLQVFKIGHFSNEIFDALLQNNIKLKKMEGWIDTSDKEFYRTTWEHGLLKYFTFTAGNMTAFRLGLIDMSLTPEKLTLIGEYLKNLEYFDIHVFYDAANNHDHVLKLITVPDLKNFLTEMKKLKHFFVYDYEFEKRDDLRTVLELFNINHI